MKTFAMLPAEVRRALAKRELARRGLSPVRPADDWRPLLRVASSDDLARMEELLTLHPPGPADELPAEVRQEWQQLRTRLGEVLRAGGP